MTNDILNEFEKFVETDLHQHVIGRAKVESRASDGNNNNIYMSLRAQFYQDGRITVAFHLGYQNIIWLKLFDNQQYENVFSKDGVDELIECLFAWRRRYNYDIGIVRKHIGELDENDLQNLKNGVIPGFNEIYTEIEFSLDVPTRVVDAY